jgi:hypothetical protein
MAAPLAPIDSLNSRFALRYPRGFVVYVARPGSLHSTSSFRIPTSPFLVIGGWFVDFIGNMLPRLLP